MRKIITTLTLLALLTVGLAQTYTFAGLEYGANPQMVEQTLSERGYTYLTEMEDDGMTAHIFSGSMFDYPIYVAAMFDAYNRLEAVSVSFYINGADIQKRDATLINLYEQLLGAVQNRYGEPFMGKGLAYADGRVDDSALREKKTLATLMWVKLAAAMAGAQDGLTLMVAPSYEQDSKLMREPGVTATENDVMLMVGYIGDPSSGDFDTGTAVDDL